MRVTIIPDEGSWVRLADAAGYVADYRQKEYATNPPGSNNAIPYTQQHSGFQWVFSVWHTPRAFMVKITCTPFTDPKEYPSVEAPASTY